ASVCALWRRLRPPPARSRSLAAAGRPFACPRSLPLLHFASFESVTGARVTARPSGTHSSGWKETPQLERRGAGERTRAPEPGASWGQACQPGNGRLSEIGALPSPYGEGGGCLLPFLRKKIPFCSSRFHTLSCLSRLRWEPRTVA
ncbi:hypothetical protein H1C71_002516, partial [Ictidomys tridecemlineatus]